MHVDLHAELHHVENGRPDDSAPCFTGFARFSSNWREPSRRKGVGIFFSRRGSACQAFYVLSTSFWTSVSLESASIPNGVVWNFDLPSSTTVSSIPLSRRRVMYFSAATKLMFDR